MTIGRGKVPARYAGLLLPLLLSIIMTCIVSLISTLINQGTSGFAAAWASAWAVSWVIAFPTLLLILPLARRFTAYLTRPPAGQG